MVDIANTDVTGGIVVGRLIGLCTGIEDDWGVDDNVDSVDNEILEGDTGLSSMLIWLC
jgi:hypothetical protein